MNAHIHVYDGKPRDVPEREHPFKLSKRVEDWLFFLWDDPCDLCGETTRETMVQVPTEDGFANYHRSCLEELADRIKKCDEQIALEYSKSNDISRAPEKKKDAHLTKKT